MQKETGILSKPRNVKDWCPLQEIMRGEDNSFQSLKQEQKSWVKRQNIWYHERTPFWNKLLVYAAGLWWPRDQWCTGSVSGVAEDKGVQRALYMDLSQSLWTMGSWTFQFLCFCRPWLSHPESPCRWTRQLGTGWTLLWHHHIWVCEWVVCWEVVLQGTAWHQ